MSTLDGWLYRLVNAQNNFRPGLVAAVAMLLGAILSLSASYLTFSNQESLRYSRLEQLSNQSADEITRHMNQYVYGLRGLRGAVQAANGHFSQSAFDRYKATQNIVRDFPGMLGYGVIQRLALGSTADYRLAMSEAGWPGLSMKRLGQNHGEPWVITHLTPLAANRAAIGLDIASEKNRHRAIRQSVASGLPTLTSPITLVQASRKLNNGFLLMLPIYEASNTPSTIKGRTAEVIGLTYAALLADMVLNASIVNGLQLSAFAIDENNKLVKFFSSSEAKELSQHPLKRTIEIPILGQRWRLIFQASPDLLTDASLIKPWQIASLGLLLSFMLALLIYSYLIIKLRQINEWISKARLGRMLKNANDAIIETDSAGCISNWNQAAEALFGYSGKEAVGKHMDQLLIPDTQLSEFIEALNITRIGQPVPHFVSQFHDAHGRPLFVDITAFPSDEEQSNSCGAVFIIHDVTLQKQSEQRIRDLNSNLESEVARRTAELSLAKRDLETIFDAMPSMIGYWDLELCNRVANKAYQQWFGGNRARIHGKHMRELLGDEIFLQNLPYIEAALRGESQTFERSMPTPNGSTKHSLAHYLPDVVNGEVQGFYAIVHDITELTESRMRLEALVQQNNILLSTINQQMLYSVTDRQGRITEANDNFCALSGYTREELLGQNHRKISSGKHPAAFWQNMWRTINSGQAWSGEVCNRSKSGELYWVESVIAPFIGANGDIEQFVSLRIDMTQRRHAEAEVARITGLLRNVLASATDFSIIATDRNGVITLFNAGAESLLQYSADEMVGLQTAAVIHDPAEVAARGRELSAQTNKDISGFDILVHKAETEGQEAREWTYVRKDGSRVRVSLTVTVLRDSGGNTTGYLGIAQDISSRLAYENALLKAKRLAETASEAKSSFLANMSHEIRTPMNGIIGLCYMLERQQMSAPSQDLVYKIQNASHQLLAIINDILDFSKIEAHRLDLELIPFDLQEAIENLRSIAKGVIGKKQVALEVDLPPREARYLIGDPTRLNQILTNLLSNAIKFTEFGRVSLKIESLPNTQASCVRLLFTITDTGIGISADKLDMIFMAFSQADNTISRNHGGTGLGLAISKRLIELMDGTLSVRSLPGHGSKFMAEIEFQLDPHELAAEKSRRISHHDEGAEKRLAGLKILLVDDSELNREVAAYILTYEGALIVTAENGQEAVSTFKQAPDTYDAVLMDIQMPILDGYDATRQIRKLLGTEHTPILALTAGAMGPQRQMALLAGMDGFISKPFEANTLITTVQQYVTAHAKAKSAAPSVDLDLEQLIAQLKQLFIQEKLPAHLEVLRKAKQSEPLNLTVLATVLHKMAGEAGTVGLMALCDKARTLENQLVDDSHELSDYLGSIAELILTGEQLIAEATDTLA
ncbi:MAG: PAS domain S-box protein [Paraperlucidibaca sp.]